MDNEPIFDYVLRRLGELKGHHRQVAADSGVPYSTLCKIVQGVTPNPGVKHVQALYDHLRAIERKAA